ncbi:hypothetical protein Tco_1044368 [Tanacetum coccineum]|uniref:Uncharacterized protein n=1 Tax=Tanacetum coccineum TaxID=301880 RepID=A0ABQ5GQ40_9ASTR
MAPIREYPLLGKLPNDSQKARKIRIKAPQYKMIDNDLYRKSCLSPWLRCVGPTQAKSIIEHAKYTHIYRGNKEGDGILTSGGSFSLRGIDIVGPLPLAPGGARFGTPQVVISDNGNEFAEGTFLLFLGQEIVYGSKAVVPIEISVETKRIKEFEARQNEKKHREDLDILEERREMASFREAYSAKSREIYNKSIDHYISSKDLCAPTQECQQSRVPRKKETNMGRILHSKEKHLRLSLQN